MEVDFVVENMSIKSRIAAGILFIITKISIERVVFWVEPYFPFLGNGGYFQSNVGRDHKGWDF